MTGSANNVWRRGIDWWSILIYVLLVLAGWMNIYSSGYNPDHPAIFDLSQRYGMQMIWIGVAFFIAITVMLIEDRYYYMLAYPAYIVSLLVLLATFVIGREVNGAKAWIFIGGFGIQPSEFVKFTTALTVARYMGSYGFDIGRTKDLLGALALIALPAAIIFLQNDAGSAIVYGAFLIVLYREGVNKWLYICALLSVAVFVMSLVLDPVTVLALLLLFFVVFDGVRSGGWRLRIIYLSAVALVSIGVYFLANALMPDGLSSYRSLLVSCAASLPPVLVYAFRRRLAGLYTVVAVFAGSVVFAAVTDYVFDQMLQTHQQQRLLHLVGLASDDQGWGYNVNQSQIAIGSGGLLGKGFRGGTQTRFDFVPEQSTDFIFSTLGEEWGFVGCVVVVGLFFALIWRLMKMGERQREPFVRIYCYSVAAFFLAHVVVNVGMTIGIMPVIGIPLPFFSYGGSSFLAFTLLFFVAVRLDAAKREQMHY